MQKTQSCCPVATVTAAGLQQDAQLQTSKIRLMVVPLLGLHACLVCRRTVVTCHLTLLTAVYTSTNSRLTVSAGVCLAAMTLLEFGKPVWVWVGLCMALAMWQKEHWNSKFGSAAVAAVICSMYVLTMQLVTSAAYWNECLWREIRISNSVFQGVVRVMESSAEALSRETAKGGIEFVGLLVSKLEARLVVHVLVYCVHVHPPASAHVMSDILVSHCSSLCLVIENILMHLVCIMRLIVSSCLLTASPCVTQNIEL